MHCIIGGGNGPDYLQYGIAPYFNNLNAIILAPTVPKDTRWSTERNTVMVEELTELAIKHWPINPKQVIVIGYSLGGEGAWKLGVKRPELIRTIVPMATDPTDFIASIPASSSVYIIHPEHDTSITIETLNKQIETAQSRGVNIQFSIVNGAQHADWDLASSEVLLAVDWVKDNFRVMEQ